MLVLEDFIGMQERLDLLFGTKLLALLAENCFVLGYVGLPIIDVTIAVVIKEGKVGKVGH